MRSGLNPGPEVPTPALRCASTSAAAAAAALAVVAEAPNAAAESGEECTVPPGRTSADSGWGAASTPLPHTAHTTAHAASDTAESRIGRVFFVSAEKGACAPM